MTPSSGEALNTDFKMSATQGWSDPDGDTIKFQFAYKSDGEADAKYFSYPPQTAPTFSTQLPTGMYSPNSKITSHIVCLAYPVSILWLQSLLSGRQFCS